MGKVQRKKNTKSDTEVLLKSKRRCCLCYGLRFDSEEKRGQIAHLDQNPSNDNTDNLAFLCLEHHDQYDSKTSQSKSIHINEIKNYREKLYLAMDNKHTTMKEPKVDSFKETGSTQRSAKALNIWLSDPPHECSFCKYSFSIMPELEEGKSYYIKQVTCPNCGNIDRVSKFYEG